MKHDLLENLQASDLPLCTQAHAEIIALRRALVNQSRAFGQWCDGQSDRAADGAGFEVVAALATKGKHLER